MRASAIRTLAQGAAPADAADGSAYPREDPDGARAAVGDVADPEGAELAAGDLQEATESALALIRS